MSETITYGACCFCNSENITKVFTAKDYTVSKTEFEIWHCNNCTGRFTQHVPDQQSIGAYYQSVDYVSHSDTKKGFINRLYHLVRKYTLQSKRKLVIQASGVAKGSLLDIGAGTGAFANEMKVAGWQVTALEPDETARQNAFNNYQLNLLAPETIYRLPGSSYDVITLWHVLEHVHDLHGYFTAFQKLLKPGGILLVAVPNYSSYDAEVYQQYWAAYDVPRHLYHFSPECMRQLAAQHGFNILSYKPMWFDSFYVSMLSEQYKNGKGNLFAAFNTGLASNRRAMKDVKKCSSVIYVMRKAG
ncbi:class I SAM-dependent methyltransferase [Foetidibacter luteolus]|uniref:class I SAM-dependent methyltransferase n=1 Tax=Foetidibacter luteolus TaxID=2608880 RepID=UPI00129A9950|nr:class I SAM-dependent methyltransferase [Foetidibacter luteolus]